MFFLCQLCYNSGTLGSGLCVCKFVALVKSSGVCVVNFPLSMYKMESFPVCLQVSKYSKSCLYEYHVMI